MRKILAGVFAAAGVLGLTATAQAGAGCDGVYSTSLDVATEESAPMSTPVGGETVATDSTTKPILPEQTGG